MRVKSWIGPLLGIVFLIVFLRLPPIEPLTPLGMRSLGVLVFTVIWWITVGIGFPSWLALALLAITGVMTAKQIFAVSFGSYLTVFMISVFGLTECLRQTGVSRRIALWFVSRPFTSGHPWLMVAMFLLGSTIMGSVMSGSAVLVTFMAIAVPLLEGLGYKKGDDFAATLVVGVGWSATAAFIMTPVGHASNILLMDWLKRDTGVILDFPKWMAIGVPAGILYYLLIVGCLRFIVRPDMSRFSAEATRWVREETSRMGSMTLEEKIAIGAFLAVLAVWILPGFAGALMPGIAQYLEGLGLAIPPLVAACLLCFIKVKNKSLITFQQWMMGVPWESVALIGAIFGIQDILANPNTGITPFLMGIFQPLARGISFFGYRVVGQFGVVTLTNFISNLVSAMIFYNAMVPAAIATGVGNAAALGFTIWCGARAGFALPSATVNTAIVTGSGWVPVGFMARHGALVSIGMVLLGIFVIYPWASFILR